MTRTFIATLVGLTIAVAVHFVPAVEPITTAEAEPMTSFDQRWEEMMEDIRTVNPPDKVPVRPVRTIQIIPIVPKPEPPAQPVAAPVEALPVTKPVTRSIRKSRASARGNVCARHGQRKLVTNGGRSWKCIR